MNLAALVLDDDFMSRDTVLGRLTADPIFRRCTGLALVVEDVGNSDEAYMGLTYCRIYVDAD